MKKRTYWFDGKNWWKKSVIEERRLELLEEEEEKNRICTWTLKPCIRPELLNLSIFILEMYTSFE